MEVFILRLKWPAALLDVVRSEAALGNDLETEPLQLQENHLLAPVDEVVLLKIPWSHMSSLRGIWWFRGC